MLLRHLRYLLAVAEHRNFTRAAEALHVSQPTLSQQVRQLEEQLRVQLLDRSGRSVRPTDAGELYLLHARRALRELEAAQRAIHEVRDLSRGRLRLGMTPTFHLLSGGRPGGSVQSALSGHRVEPRGVAPGRPGGGADRRSPWTLAWPSASRVRWRSTASRSTWSAWAWCWGRNTRRRTRRWPPQRWRSCRWRCCATTSPRAGTSTLTCASKG
ncbi:DNA-binding transcriptional regulator CynR [Pseudomonas aeruginosa]|nr:DNA-binding transcriptional regulator CynR [Pseudomonas aeruginosa]